MQLLSKDRALLLTEACKREDFYCCGDDDCSHGELDDELFDIPELEDEIDYCEEMVAIIATESTAGPMYLVEYDCLVKLMESKNYDEVEAINALAEHNDISTYSMYVVIESQEAILEKMEEVGAKGGTMFRKDVKKDTMKTLKDLKKKGLNIVKKKSSDKKKKGNVKYTSTKTTAFPPKVKTKQFEANF